MVLLIQRLGTQSIQKVSAPNTHNKEDALGLIRKNPSPSVATKLAWGAGILATVALAPRALLHLVPKSTWQHIEECTLYAGTISIPKSKERLKTVFESLKEQLPNLESHSLSLANNQTTQTWYHPAQEGKPTFLLSLGNAQPLDGLNAYKEYIKQGYGIITYEYPGFGTTNGQPTEASIMQTAKAVSDFLIQKKGIPTTQQVLVGHSLGCNPSVHLAETAPYKALILNAPMNSFTELIRKKYGWLTRWFPIHYHAPSRWHNDQILNQNSIPVFVIAFKKDPVIQPELSQKLYQIAQTTNKTFHSVEGEGHVALPSDVLKEVTDFLNRLDS